MIIEGNKVDLMPITYSDIKNKEYMAWLNNKKLLKYSSQRFEKYNFNKLKNFFLLTKKNNNFFYKILTKNNHFIGTILCTIDKNHKSGNLGILIGNLKFQSKGYGIDAWSIAIKYLQKKRKLKKIYAGTLSCNKPMLKIFKKSKMTYETRFKKHEIVNKKYYDLIYYSVFTNS
jgi:RimJ/RimL family protein N-acetyltransferase